MTGWRTHGDDHMVGPCPYPLSPFDSFQPSTPEPTHTYPTHRVRTPAEINATRHSRRPAGSPHPHHGVLRAPRRQSFSVRLCRLRRRRDSGGGSGTSGAPSASLSRARVRRIGAETRGARGGENGEGSNATTRPDPLTAFNHLKFPGPMPRLSRRRPPPRLCDVIGRGLS